MTKEKTINDHLNPGDFIVPDYGLQKLKDAYKDFLKAFEQTKASTDQIINVLTKIENDMANEAFAKENCDTCGSPHDEEGYGYHDDGEDCLENPDNK